MRAIKRYLTHAGVLLAGTSAAALLVSPALADTVPTTSQDNVGSAEIVVTAQKRSESIQKVPISMQALSSANLEQHQAQSFDDYTKLLPSVSFQSFGPGQSQLFFRGITSGGDGLPFGALPTSGVYIDETPVTTIGSLLDVHVYDMQRIEALSGPQGTLYGASSLSGTLRMITNKPDFNNLSAAMDITGDKYGKGAAGGTVEGFINVPLGHGMAVRAVGWYEHDGGYIDNTLGTRTYQRPHTDLTTGDIVDSPYTTTNAPFVKNNFNDVDTYGGRLMLGIELDNGWTVTPELMAQHQLSHGSFLYDPRVGDLEVHDFAPESNLDEWYQASLTVQGKLGSWDVLYSGSYMGRKIHTQADYSYYTVAYDSTPNTNYFVTASGANIDPTQYFTGNQNMTKQTHELRVNSPLDKAFRVTAGAFYQRQANQSYMSYYAPGVSQNDYPDWWDGSTVYGDSIFMTNAKIIDRDYALFGQAVYDITSSLTVTGGIRGFISDNTLTGFSGYSYQAPSTCAVPFPTLDSCSNLDKKATSSGETHKINLTWQVDADRMVYVTYSTGFRPGGNNRQPNVNPYAPDTLDNFELGWKTSWLDHKFKLNGALYYEKWNNLQYALVVADSGGLTNIYNAGDARVYGAEVDVMLRPTKGFTLSASGAYNNSALTTNFCLVGVNSAQNCADGVTAPAGTRLPVQPRFKGNATARYEFPLGQINAHVQASALHQSSSSSFLSVSDNAVVGNSAPFSTFDFAIGGSKGATSVELFIQNAFNERGSLSHNVFTTPSTSGQYYRIYPTKPQYFGIKVGRKF
jgi:outer membrane receptor protein involved in Fe transport